MSARELQAAIGEHLTTMFPNVRSMVRSPYRLTMTGDASAKLRKGETSIYGVSMPPARLWIAADGTTSATLPDCGGVWQYFGNVCPWADGCVETCIASTGHYGMGQSIARAWVRVLWHTRRDLFVALLTRELSALNVKARKSPGRVAVRLNVTSDIRWERHIDMASYDALTFYDYTKAAPAARSAIAPNYDLTFSVTRRWSVDDMRAAAADGRRLAVIVPDHAAADAPTIAGIPAVNGDHSDERFADAAGVAVLLRVKRPTNRAPIAAIYDGGMVRDAAGSIAVRG